MRVLISLVSVQTWPTPLRISRMCTSARYLWKVAKASTALWKRMRMCWTRHSTIPQGVWLMRALCLCWVVPKVCWSNWQNSKRGWSKKSDRDRKSLELWNCCRSSTRVKMRRTTLLGISSSNYTCKSSRSRVQLWEGSYLLTLKHGYSSSLKRTWKGWVRRWLWT